MTKKKKGIIIAVVAVIVAAAVGIGIYFGLVKPNTANSDNITAAEGELYRTKTETFWGAQVKHIFHFNTRKPLKKALPVKQN